MQILEHSLIGQNKIELNWIELIDFIWIEWNWIYLNWIELNWTELILFYLNWIELSWIELNWKNLLHWLTKENKKKKTKKKKRKEKKTESMKKKEKLCAIWEPYRMPSLLSVRLIQYDNDHLPSDTNSVINTHTYVQFMPFSDGIDRSTAKSPPPSWST